MNFNFYKRLAELKAEFDEPIAFQLCMQEQKEAIET